MLVEEFERAKRNPDDNSRFAYHLKRIFKSIEEEKDLYSGDKEEIEEIDELPLSGLVEALKSWYNNEDFEEARRALGLLDDFIEESMGNDWHRVTTQLYHRKIKLKAGLSGHDPVTELESVLDFFTENESGLSKSNCIPQIFELIEKNLDCLDEGEKREWIRLCDTTASELHGEDYKHERKFISYKITLKEELGECTEEEQEELIQSFEKEAEYQGKRSQLIKATVIEQGMRRCAKFLDDQTLDEWKREAVESRRKAAENEMTELPLNDDFIEALAEEEKENADILVNWFERTAETYESSTYALYCLLCSDGYEPNYEQARRSERGFAFRNAFQTQYTSPEGHALGINPSARDDDDDRRIPSSYTQTIDSKTRTLAEALYRLIDDGEISEFDFFVLFEIANLSPHTRAFLTDATYDLFDGNYVQSLGVAMPHFEGAIVDTLDYVGQSATGLTDEGTQQQAFGGLLEDLEGEINKNYLEYLKLNYTDKRGMNHRNRWSHGQFKYFQANFRTAALGIFDTLKTIIELNPSPFVAVFSLPSETISTEIPQFDVSEHLDSNQTVLACGYADGTGLIVAEEEEKTPILVVQGSIAEEYGPREIELNREQIEEHIRMLEQGVSGIPEDMELIWLDTDNAIRKQVLQIILQIIESGGCAPKDDVITIANKFGLTSEVVEDTIEKLISRDKIVEGNEGFVEASN